MAKKPWMPYREDEMLPWFNNFNTKLPSYTTTLDLSAEDIASVAADSAMVEFAINGVAIFKAEQKEWVDFKDLELYGSAALPTPAEPSVPELVAPAVVAPGIIGRVRALVARIKANPNYTDVIGEDLGVIGAEHAAVGVVKPEGKATALPKHEVQITFVKSGHAGVDVEGQRGDESDWTHLAFDGYSPYVDNRPPLNGGLPEQRRYRLRYRDRDTPVGEFSDVFVVTTEA